MTMMKRDGKSEEEFFLGRVLAFNGACWKFLLSLRYAMKRIFSNLAICFLYAFKLTIKIFIMLQ
jgi:hypothetical protein